MEVGNETKQLIHQNPTTSQRSHNGPEMLLKDQQEEEPNFENLISGEV